MKAEKSFDVSDAFMYRCRNFPIPIATNCILCIILYLPPLSHSYN